MPSLTDDTTIDTQLRLSDLRLRVLNNERVSAEEFRVLLDDLRRDRESASRASAASRRAVKRASTTLAASPTLSLDTLFPGVTEQ
jgi:hypothetical protein